MNLKEKISENSDKIDKKQIIFIFILFATIFVLYRPILYTYFCDKAEKTSNVEAKVQYAKKALRFGSLEQGNTIYSYALRDYIKSIANDRPSDALEIINKESSNITNHSAKDQTYAYLYMGMAHKMRDADANLALYDYVKAEYYDKEVIAKNAEFHNLMNTLLVPYLNQNEKVIDTVSGEISGASNGIAIVASDGIHTRLVIFNYSGDKFSKVDDFTLQSSTIKNAEVINISDQQKAFVIIDDIKNEGQEINVISYNKGKYNSIYSHISKDGFIIGDVDDDDNYEIGIRQNIKGNSSNYNIIWLKYVESNFQYYNNTGSDKKLQNNSSSLLLY